DPVQAGVAGLVDDAHTAFAERFEDVIVRQLSGSHGRSAAFGEALYFYHRRGIGFAYDGATYAPRNRCAPHVLRAWDFESAAARTSPRDVRLARGGCRRDACLRGHERPHAAPRQCTGVGCPTLRGLLSQTARTPREPACAGARQSRPRSAWRGP